jgi:hypothetical protein
VHFRLEQHFAGPADRVQQALLDPSFLARLATLPKLGHPELLDRDDDGTTVHQRIRYAFTGELSPVVTAVLDPAKLTWVEESTVHRASLHTTFRIRPDHYADRLACNGAFQLVPMDGGADGPRTQRITEADVTVRFPLVAGRVERAIVSGLTEHAELEVAVVDRWLAEDGH